MRTVKASDVAALTKELKRLVAWLDEHSAAPMGITQEGLIASAGCDGVPGTCCSIRIDPSDAQDAIGRLYENASEG